MIFFSKELFRDKNFENAHYWGQNSFFLVQRELVGSIYNYVKEGFLLWRRVQEIITS